MFLSFVLSYLSRPSRYVWSPSLDMTNNEVVSTLIPGAQY